jgi:predicted AlkP superfamily pyrophosphatase or phosphodiesterase
MTPSRTLFIPLLLLVACHAALAQPAATKRVLILGIDGCRTDALQAADTPHLDQLVREGAIAQNTSVLGSRITGADTVSGPGWSAILTGVWADKHGVRDNKFTGANYEKYPHFFARLKQARPTAVTISVSTWPPIHDRIVSAADVSLSLLTGDDYAAGDARVTAEAVRLLQEKDPDALFVYLGNVDETGHKAGFHPSVKPYIAALEQADAHVGAILAALRNRPRYAEEDWLVLVTTDHGGRGTNHGGGHLFADIRTVFLIVSGPSAVRGRIDGPTSLVDIPATALAHLGIPLDPAWALDGRAVGLKAR